MTDATLLWSIWQALLWPFHWAFTRSGFRRFVEWVTGLALNVEEHTVTQSLIGLDRVGDWKALESFAEYGCWSPRCLALGLTAPQGVAELDYLVTLLDAPWRLADAPRAARVQVLGLRGAPRPADPCSPEADVEGSEPRITIPLPGCRRPRPAGL